MSDKTALKGMEGYSEDGFLHFTTEKGCCAVKVNKTCAEMICRGIDAAEARGEARGFERAKAMASDLYFQLGALYELDATGPAQDMHKAIQNMKPEKE